MNQRLYPDHIYDPQRVAMAAEITQKELRKLFPSAPAKDWPTLDKDLANWFDGSRSELAPVHDFWNGTEAITQGIKLKRLVRYISAANINWQKRRVAVDDIPIGWAVGTIEKALGKPPWKAQQIRDALAGDQGLMAENLKLSDEHSASSLPRDHYPVYVMTDGVGYTLLDGNRRTLRAILHKHSDIEAYVGTTAEYHNIRDYWVSTAFLRNLVRVAETADDETVTEGVRRVLSRLFSETVIAKINYAERVVAQSALAKKLYQELT